MKTRMAVFVLVIILVAAIAGIGVRAALRSGAPSTGPTSTLTLSASLSGGTSSTQIAHDYTGTIESGGLERQYIVHLPTTYNASLEWPLVLVLHGGEGNGSGMNNLTGFNAVADADNFIVVYPVGYMDHWADGRGTDSSDIDDINDTAFISSLIDQLISSLHADPSRVYVSGISDGGFMALRLACQLSDKITAIAVVAATIPTNDVSGCKPGRQVPMMLIHGSNDTFVPASGGQMTVGTGGEIQSVNQTLQLWTTLSNCSSTPVVTDLPVIVHDGTTVVKSQYFYCQGDGSVIFYNIMGGGHTWPDGEQYLPVSIIGKTSHNLDASLVIWEFFQPKVMGGFAPLGY